MSSAIVGLVIADCIINLEQLIGWMPYMCFHWQNWYADWLSMHLKDLHCFFHCYLWPISVLKHKLIAYCSIVMDHLELFKYDLLNLTCQHEPGKKLEYWSFAKNIFFILISFIWCNYQSVLIIQKLDMPRLHCQWLWK